MKRIGFWLIGFGLLSSCSTDTPSGPSFDDQLKKDVVAVDAYLTSKGITAIQDPTGARYAVTTNGTGSIPGATDTAYVSLKTTVMSSGAVYFDSKDDFYSVILSSQNLLYSWKAVIPKINRGSSFTIYSPSGLAYGTSSSANGVLPANSNIIFDMKLFDDKAFDKAAQFKADTTAIQNYLTTNAVANYVKDASGLRYVVTTVGTGAKPTATSTISFTYTGKFLKSGTTFDSSSTPVSSRLSGLIKGFQIGMSLLNVGSKATLYIPSSLAYGLFGSSGTIPSNANLIFEVELVSIN